MKPPEERAKKQRHYTERCKQSYAPSFVEKRFPGLRFPHKLPVLKSRWIDLVYSANLLRETEVSSETERPPITTEKKLQTKRPRWFSLTYTYYVVVSAFKPCTTENPPDAIDRSREQSPEQNLTSPHTKVLPGDYTPQQSTTNSHER